MNSRENVKFQRGCRHLLFVFAAALGSALFCTASARGATVTLAPGQTLDWSTSAPASGSVLSATGGTIVFPASATVDNEFQLGGEVSAGESKE